MAIHLGAYIASERTKRRLRYGDLARLCGGTTPRQTSRISQRLVLFEREGVEDIGLLKKVVAALDLDVDVVNEMLRRDHDEAVAAWEAWVSEPVEPELHVKAGPVWVRRSLPPSITTEEEAVTYALEISKSRFFQQVVLQWDRRAVHVVADGVYQFKREARPDRANTPFMTVKGKPFIFAADDDR